MTVLLKKMSNVKTRNSNNNKEFKLNDYYSKKSIYKSYKIS